MHRKSQSERVRVKEEVGPLGTGNTPQWDGRGTQAETKLQRFESGNINFLIMTLIGHLFELKWDIILV